jgi:hypothetical protein
MHAPIFLMLTAFLLPATVYAEQKSLNGILRDEPASALMLGRVVIMSEVRYTLQEEGLSDVEVSFVDVGGDSEGVSVSVDASTTSKADQTICSRAMRSVLSNVFGNFGSIVKDRAEHKRRVHEHYGSYFHVSPLTWLQAGRDLNAVSIGEALSDGASLHMIISSPSGDAECKLPIDAYYEVK